MLPEIACLTRHKTTSSAQDNSENYFSETEDYGNESYVTQKRNFTKQKTKNRLYNCDICDKHFVSPAHLSEHKISHSTVKNFTCSLCSKSFKRKNALSKHFRNFHNSEKIKCSCGKIFSAEKAVEKHKADDNCYESLNCSECGACYKTRSSLESHLMLHRFEQNNINTKWPYTCPVCYKNFSSPISLSNHMSDKHSQEKTLPCQDCDKVFRTKQLLRHHLLRKHKYDPSSICICSVCNKEFSIAKDLRRHMQSHNIGRYCDCLLCGAKFKSSRTLQSHMKLHSQGKPYDCLICLIPFEALANLQQHLISFHKLDINEESFGQTWNRKCPICSRLFLRRSAAVAHIKSHMDNENIKVLLVEEKDKPICYVDNSNNRNAHNDMYVHVIEVGEQAGQLTRNESSVENVIRSGDINSEKNNIMELIDNQIVVHTDKMLPEKKYLGTASQDEINFTLGGNSLEKVEKTSKKDPNISFCSSVSPNQIYDEFNNDYVFLESSNAIHPRTDVKSTSASLQSSVKLVNDNLDNEYEDPKTSGNTAVPKEKTIPKRGGCELYEYQENEYFVNDNLISLESSEIRVNQVAEPQRENSPKTSYKTSDSQFIDIFKVEDSEFDTVNSVFPADMSKFPVENGEFLGENGEIPTENNGFPADENNLTASNSIFNASEETTYICGQCSLVFTNVSTLQSHIINCYNQETSEEYVVVFEAEEGSK